METQTVNSQQAIVNKEKHQAIDRVLLGNLNFYQEAYEYAKKWLLTRVLPFTTDDIIEDYRREFKIEAQEPRVWGAVIRQLKRNKLISPTGEYKISRSKKGHGHTSREWKKVVNGTLF